MTRKRFTKEFRDEAVQLAINSDIPKRQLAEDLGVGKSTLFKWITDYRQKQGLSNNVVVPANELKLELLRLRKENTARGARHPKKSNGLLRKPKVMRYRFIEAQKAGQNIGRLCKLLKISRSGYYSWRTRPMSKHQQQDIVLLAHFRAEFEASYYSYGRPRMVKGLREKGFNVGHTPVGRLMRDNGLKAIRTRKRRYQSYNRIMPSMGYSPNLLKQNFTAKTANQKWVADISYIATSQGWLYLAIVMDLYSRRIVGWSISNRMKQDLALRALQMAITLRCPDAGLVHHSDRGRQYTATEYQMLLKQHKINSSMSGIR